MSEVAISGKSLVIANFSSLILTEFTFKRSIVLALLLNLLNKLRNNLGLLNLNLCLFYDFLSSSFKQGHFKGFMFIELSSQNQTFILVPLYNDIFHFTANGLLDYLDSLLILEFL